MNKIIEQFAIKSDLVYKTWPDSKTLFVEGHATTISGKPALMSNCPDYDNSVAIEKFAQLVIEETIHAIIKGGRGHLNPSLISKSAKEHFGIDQ